ncbi:MAG: 16S rRNA (cytosine(1402)-N(4))-methyltransferase, partial [Planctomycetia bacterium]
LLQQLPLCVKPEGRAVLISFHSLEDRRVKQAFADRPRWERLTKKPALADDDESRRNPRSRSAKLRAAIRRDGPPVGGSMGDGADPYWRDEA